MRVLLFLVIGIIVMSICAGACAADSTASNEAWKKIKAGALVLDVRTPAEFASGHIEGALNIPYDQVAARVSELGPNKDREIVLYCKSGGRSGTALKTLTGLGFSHLMNAGGFEDLNKSKPRL